MLERFYTMESDSRRFLQVTGDDCPIIFHDYIILSEDSARAWYTRRRRLFQKVKPSLGFNFELKFDEEAAYQVDDLVRVLQAIMNVVASYADQRPVIFSSFHPHMVILVLNKITEHLDCSRFPKLFFLTDGRMEIFHDMRRNSLEEVIKVCTEGGLQGIISEVTAIFQNPVPISKIKESNLSLLTNGNRNNYPESVHAQHQMGINGVIVDLVREITEAVTRSIKPPKDADSD
ncbi:hypothetical protein MLD38_000288 [Melastoma candidum]|uniref:Uncharacterized protein n=1 Tax=Melastoma candidum TaxID=119954 RepID=A0ACB9S973_9MYRT|nr:hypothetical protein MLD38_000288 [Melastoma candidum]